MNRRINFDIVRGFSEHPGEEMESEKIDTLQKTELAEGVEVHLRVAGPMARSLAWLNDVIRIGLCYVVIGLLMGFVLSRFLGWNVVSGIMLIVMFLFSWFYFVYFESGKRSATPGKKRMGLKVVDITGAPVTVSQAIIRNFLRFIDFFPAAYGVGLFTCLFTKKFQRLGDLVAGTVVVYAAHDDRMDLNLSNAKPKAPMLALTREEQRALLMYTERAQEMSPSRLKELAGHASELVTEPEPERQLQEIAKWIHESK